MIAKVVALHLFALFFVSVFYSGSWLLFCINPNMGISLPTSVIVGRVISITETKTEAKKNENDKFTRNNIEKFNIDI